MESYYGDSDGMRNSGDNLNANANQLDDATDTLINDYAALSQEDLQGPVGEHIAESYAKFTAASQAQDETSHQYAQVASESGDIQDEAVATINSKV